MTETANRNRDHSAAGCSWFGIPGTARRLNSIATRPNLSDLGLSITDSNTAAEVIQQSRTSSSVGDIPISNSVETEGGTFDYYRAEFVSLLANTQILNRQPRQLYGMEVLSSCVRVGKKFVQKGLDIASNFLENISKSPTVNQNVICFKGYEAYIYGSVLKFDSLEMNSTEAAGSKFRLKLKVEIEHFAFILGYLAWIISHSNPDKWTLTYNVGSFFQGFIEIHAPPEGFTGTLTYALSSDNTFITIDIP